MDDPTNKSSINANSTCGRLNKSEMEKEKGGREASGDHCSFLLRFIRSTPRRALAFLPTSGMLL